MTTLEFPITFDPLLHPSQLDSADETYLSGIMATAGAKTYTQPECSVSLPFDGDIVEQAQNLHQRITSAHPLKFVVVVGIGGSNLGTLAIYDAIYKMDDVYGSDIVRPRLLTLDTVHDATTARICDHLEQNMTHVDDVVICIVSKSGNTTETMANANILIQALEPRFGSIHERIVIITDPASALHSLALDRKYNVLTLPKQVGGRYSVFSAVGIFPLICLKIDVEALLRGARDAINGLDSPDSIARRAYLDIKTAYDAGLGIHDLFLFDPRLETLGKWYRQLLAESLGKDGKGMLPTVSIGSTDLHSVAQLYLGGPNDRYTSFVWVEQGTDCVIDERPSLALVENLGQKSLSTIYHAIYEGTREAYTKMGRMHDAYHFSTLDAESLGCWMQSAMLWTMMLGRHMAVNSFDQPQVEVYKIATRSILNHP
ncbi:MAG: hypothetical protein WCO78_03000 [Candidatus Roizmanbacteria bacterium]